MDFTKIGILEIDGERVAIRPIELEQRYGEETVLKAILMPIFNESNARFRKKNVIKNVIFNDPATIVIWSDGTKTVVKCQPGDTYDAEKGLALCIAKKYLGNKGNFNEVFKKWIPEEKDEKEEKITNNVGGPKVGTWIKILKTEVGCLGAEGKIGVVTNIRSNSGLFATDPGYNVRVGSDVWRINPNAKIAIINKEKVK